MTFTEKVRIVLTMCTLYISPIHVVCQLLAHIHSAYLHLSALSYHPRVWPQVLYLLPSPGFCLREGTLSLALCSPWLLVCEPVRYVPEHVRL